MNPLNFSRLSTCTALIPYKTPISAWEFIEQEALKCLAKDKDLDPIETLERLSSIRQESRSQLHKITIVQPILLINPYTHEAVLIVEVTEVAFSRLPSTRFPSFNPEF